MPQVTAKLNNLRISPRKIRAVCDLLRGLEVDKAKAQLGYLVKRSARPLDKLLDSAVSNARSAFGLDKNYLYIKELTVNEGRKLKRYKAKGFGRTMPIQKKTSHVRMVLEELPEEKKKKKEALMARMPKIEEVKKIIQWQADRIGALERMNGEKHINIVPSRHIAIASQD